jgi:hypothetical protein
MLNWLQNPHSDYVIAAYGVALTALAGLVITSLHASRRAIERLKKIESQSHQGRP